MASIGDTLREERLRRGQTPAEAAREVGAPRATLHALEAGTGSLDEAHTRGYLRMYARYLGLDAEALLRDLDELPDAPPAEEVAPPPPAAARPTGSTPGGHRAQRPQAAEGSSSSFFTAGEDDNDNSHAANRTNGVAVLEATEEPRAPAAPSGKSGKVVALMALGVLAGVLTGTAVVLWAGADDQGATVALDAPPAVQAPAAPEIPGSGEAAGASQGTADGGEADAPAATTAEPDAAQPGSAQRGSAQPDGAQQRATPDGHATNAVRSPEVTQVQVLHNDAPPAVVAKVVELLESWGYDVVWVNEARVGIERTTVYAVAGWEAEAEALTARDERLGAFSPNDRFSPAVPLHVAIGPDWVSQG